MPGSWLLLPILFPLLGGLGVLGIHTLKTRWRWWLFWGRGRRSPPRF